MSALDDLAAAIASGEATPARVYDHEVWFHATHAYCPPEYRDRLANAQRLTCQLVAHLWALGLRPKHAGVSDLNSMLAGSRWPDLLTVGLAVDRLQSERSAQLAGRSVNNRLAADLHDIDNDPIAFTRKYHLRYHHGRIISTALTAAVEPVEPTDLTEPAARARRAAAAVTWRDKNGVTPAMLQPTHEPTPLEVASFTSGPIRPLDKRRLPSVYELAFQVDDLTRANRRNEQHIRELLKWRTELAAAMPLIPATSSEWPAISRRMTNAQDGAGPTDVGPAPG